MSVIILRRKPTPDEIKAMSEEFGTYLKLVVDLENKIMTGGGELHADGEKELLSQGSKQIDLWGGGYDQLTKNVDYLALINIRAQDGNPGMEVIDPVIRQRFLEVVKMYLDVSEK